MRLLRELDVNGEMRLRCGLRCDGEWKYRTDQERQEQTTKASQETDPSMSESDQAGKLVPGAATEWKPVDFASAAVARDHDGLHAREGAQAFGAVIAAVATHTISTKCSIWICNVTDDVIDAATSNRKLSSDAIDAC